eukprot:COSAG05_NODE_1935_length_3814_cov_2.663795_2_plen_177_part_00
MTYLVSLARTASSPRRETPPPQSPISRSSQGGARWITGGFGSRSSGCLLKMRRRGRSLVDRRLRPFWSLRLPEWPLRLRWVRYRRLLLEAGSQCLLVDLRTDTPATSCMLAAARTSSVTAAVWGPPTIRVPTRQPLLQGSVVPEVAPKPNWDQRNSSSSSSSSSSRMNRLGSYLLR